MKLWMLTAVISVSSVAGWLALSGQQKETNTQKIYPDISLQKRRAAEASLPPRTDQKVSFGADLPAGDPGKTAGNSATLAPDNRSHKELIAAYSHLSDEDIDREIRFINSYIDQNNLTELANSGELTRDEKIRFRSHLRKKVALHGIKVSRMIQEGSRDGVQTHEG